MTCVCIDCLGFDPLDPSVTEGKPITAGRTPEELADLIVRED